MKKYDAIVVGAGHAGLEAAFALAKLNKKTALFTLNKNSVGMMPCNPSIGGPAKGIVTREIDALGGMQAKAADANQLQMKILNLSKGPGVWALRAQIDKIEYSKWFLNQVENQENLDLVIDEVCEILVHNNKVIGIKAKEQIYICDTVVLTTGTYLNSITHKGNDSKKEGPDGLEFSNHLSDSLKKLGIELIRLKTGTPARILKDSIDYSVLELEPGTNDKLCFSLFEENYLDFDKQLPCYILHTTPETHELINANLDKSAMYGGIINGIGPRYCPSIEDKIVKFPDKPRHQIFVEPESKSLDTVYLAGFSTSMPVDIQDKMLRTLPGFKNCVVKKYAYAIEYDAINPMFIDLTLMSKTIKGLFFGGQINGTSGYEEAAAQGLIAGINAYNYLENKEPLILSRTESYIGVMIDDIVTKGISEPYRLLTSRAEHRLFLRNDNADDRLLKYGYNIGLISEEVWNKYQHKNNEYKKIIEFLKTKTIGQIEQLKHQELKTNSFLYDYAKRPEIKLYDLLEKIDFLKEVNLTKREIHNLEIRIKFEGYIKNQEEFLKKLQKIDKISLTEIQDYKEVPNIAIEAIEKLNKIRPLNLDQASRISGITLNDIARIKYYLESKKK